MLDLFADEAPWQEPLADGALILRRFACADATLLLAEIKTVAQQSPFRQLVTPGGHTMSVSMTNCGRLGWRTDSRGYYCYSPYDGLNGKPWPGMPDSFKHLASTAANEAGYPDFMPDACLINRYPVAAKLSLHQDKDEPDLRQPIVSVSLGLPAIFQFGGLQRNAPIKRVMLEHGDVVVWGGASRLCFHGILPLKADYHPATGPFRFNITFRHASKHE